MFVLMKVLSQLLISFNLNYLSSVAFINGSVFQIFCVKEDIISAINSFQFELPDFSLAIKMNYYRVINCYNYII